VPDNTSKGRRSAVKGLAVGLGLALVAGACGGDGGPVTERGAAETTSTTEALGAPVHGGEITVGLETETNSWLPGEVALASSGNNVAFAIYDPLLVRAENGELKPYLAKAFSHNDVLTEWTVELRPGITFHDGTTFDAHVLKAIFDEYLMAPASNTAGTLAGIELRVDDDLTVTYLLPGPDAGFPELLRGVQGMPFSVEAARAAGPDAGSKPVGTGPFMLEQWARDDRLVVVKNPNYWREGLPYLDKITFRPIPDEQARVQTLLADGIDAIHTLRGSTVKELLDADEERFTSHVSSGDEMSVSIMNVLQPPFDDLRIRRAFAHMRNADDVAMVLGSDGLAAEATQYFASDSPWYSDEVAASVLPYDPARAKALVAEYVADPNRSDGRAVGEKPLLRYQCLPDPSLLELGQLVQGEALAAGFEVELTNIEQASLIANVIGGPATDPPMMGDYMVSCFRATNPGDPAATFAGAFGPVDSQIMNFTNFTSPELTELVESLRTTAAFDERRRIVERVGLIINDQVPMTYSASAVSAIGVRQAVKNLDNWTVPDGSVGHGTTFGVARWGEVWLDR
jgi:peptide/nickel transport system substrate-binding protein